MMNIKNQAGIFPKQNNRYYHVIVSQNGENFVNPGMVVFRWKDGGGTMGQASASDLIHGESVHPVDLNLMLEHEKIVFVGEHVCGGIGLQGEGVEIKFRRELEEAATPYLVDLSNRKFWPLLRQLAKKDLEMSHNKQDDEI